MGSKFLTFVLSFLLIISAFGAINDTTKSQSTSAVKTIIIDAGHGGQDIGARSSSNTESKLALAISLKVQQELKSQMPDKKIIMTRTTDILPGNLTNVNAALRYRANLANESNGDLFISIHLNATAGNQKYGKRAVGTKEEKYFVWSGKGKSRKKVWKTRTVTQYERYKLPATVKGTQTYILAKDWYNGKLSSVSKMDHEEDPGGESDTLSADMLDINPLEAKIRASQYTKYYFTKSLNLATLVEEQFAAIGRYSWGVKQRDWAGIWVLQATQMPCILIESGFIDNPEDEDFLASEEGQTKMAKAIVTAIKNYTNTLDNKTDESVITTNAPIPAPISN